MTSIDRTAYPRPGDPLTAEELNVRYLLNEADLFFVRDKALTDTGRVTLATVLKGRQDLGYFPSVSDVHVGTLAYLAAQLDLDAVPPLLDETRQRRRSTAIGRRYAFISAWRLIPKLPSSWYRSPCLRQPKR
ncbi:DUF4158 domain-containing protein [Mesorhizobium sp. M0016]|uniref:DUF4158 domain-containing protein n=1 Tax=Mesorhizobium sp. M0016 TaxID=2956843 RepID=UPI0033398EB8